MQRRARFILASLLLVACTDIISPPRVEYYEYRKFTNNSEGELVAMAFNWPRASLPIRIWIEPGDALRPALERAIPIWENTFLYGEVRFEMVADQSAADIVVRNEVAGPKPEAAFRLGRVADQCRGETTFLADVDAGTLELPFEVYVWSRIGNEGPGLAECYELTLLHEIGHALGIFEHSVEPDDLMYADPERNGLSARDRATAEAVYHLPTTLRPVR